VPTWWLCGQAANGQDLAGRFDAVFLLEIDQDLVAGRMRVRSAATTSAGSVTAWMPPSPASPLGGVRAR
jgi:hypothetical protein